MTVEKCGGLLYVVDVCIYAVLPYKTSFHFLTAVFAEAMTS
jgi:hypothetical protein